MSIKKIYLLNFILFGLVPTILNATTYSWNTWVAGTLAYSAANMTATVTNTAFDTRGPQDPNGGAGGGYQSPKYVSAATINTYQGGFTNDYGQPGLVLGLDWTNLTSSTTLTITFTTPIAGPVSFDLYDINTGAWGGNDPVWIDKVTIAGTNCAGGAVYPTITGCSNAISGTNNNTLTGNIGCTNVTNTITFNSPTIKTITLTYFSGSPLSAGYGTDPDPEYIIVSDITASNNTLITAATPGVLGCTVSTITLSGSSSVGGATFAWTGPNSGNPAGTTPNNSSTDVSAAGTYVLAVTDPSSGCVFTDTVVVTTNSNPPDATIAPPASLSCTNANVTLTASSSVGGVTYAWSGGGTANTLVVTMTGTYTVTVTNPANGCSATASATVNSTSTVITCNTAPTGTTCGNSDGSAIVNVTAGTGPFTYAWSSGDMNQTAVNLAGGNYTVTVTGAGGCTATASATVASSTGITLSSSSTDATCGNNNGSATVNVTAGTVPFSYNWSDGETLSAISNLPAGSYDVTVTGAGGCTATATTTVGSSGGLTLSTSSTNTSCGNNNGSAMTNVTAGTGPFSYTWSDGETSQALSNLASGTYTVTVTGVGGCSATASAIVNPSGGTNVTINSDKTVMCASDTATICAPGGFVSYLWNTGDTTQCILTQLAGNYYVTVTDNGSCTATSNHISIAVHTPPPVSISVNGDTLTAYNAVTYQWYLDGNPIPGATSQNYIITQGGSYTVAVTDTNGCGAVSTPVVISSSPSLTLPRGEGILVYPNPSSSGIWQMTVGKELVGGRMEVFDAEGRLVVISNIEHRTSNIELNAARGIYLLRITSERKTVEVKLVKM